MTHSLPLPDSCQLYFWRCGKNIIQNATVSTTTIIITKYNHSVTNIIINYLTNETFNYVNNIAPTALTVW